VINDTEISPPARIYHRIKGGEENNVYDYFNNIINDKNNICGRFTAHNRSVYASSLR
jgi:hypothetical protein